MRRQYFFIRDGKIVGKAIIATASAAQKVRDRDYPGATIAVLLEGERFQ